MIGIVIKNILKMEHQMTTLSEEMRELTKVTLKRKEKEAKSKHISECKSSTLLSEEWMVANTSVQVLREVAQKGLRSVTSSACGPEYSWADSASYHHEYRTGILDKQIKILKDNGFTVEFSGYNTMYPKLTVSW